MHRLLNSARNNNPTNLNKPLPEPLVDPDEGKTPIGELVIIPIQGKDLPNRERFGKQDPFILFRLGNVSKRGITDVRGGQRPVWKDDQINIFMYESDAKDAKSLYVTCLDEDPKKNDLIGDCVINLAKVLEQGEHDDWFELSYKGREAGQLLLQLTYYSHDPKHPTNKMNRVSAPASGAAARRPIHTTKEQKPEEKPVEEDAHVDEGPVYKPPVVPEAPVYKDPVPVQTPMVAAAGYPYGAPVAGRPVSPAGHGHYVGHHTPQVPPVNPYAPPTNPYAPATAAYPGYPTAGAFPGQVPHDPTLADPKRLSFTGQPQPGFPVAAVLPVAPVAGYSPNPAYPPQVPAVGGFPPQGNSPSFPPSSVYPPQNTGFPNTGYPPAGASPFPAAQQLPITQGLGGAPGGPPAGYPFAAPNVYPPNNNNSNGGGPGPFPNNNNNNMNNFGNNNTPNNSFGGNNFGGNGNGGNFNSNSNNNGGSFNNINGGNFNSNNGGSFNNNNGNNGGNFNRNNGGSFNSGGNFNNSNNSFGNNSSNNNSNNNFGNNNPNNNFNNSNNSFNSNNSNNNFNSNNSNNNFNNNNNNSNSAYTQGGYSSPNSGNFTPKATPVVPKPIVSPVTHHQSLGESMYGPGGI
ncbi:hypothetical protein BG000_001803 [Podila horticola]|nr:hypothetical protein BG000_001803 [Podila horticola]